MATEVLLIREGNKLAAAEPMSFEVIEGMKRGEMVTCTLRRTRNGRHHRLFMALMSAVFKAQDKYATFKNLLDVVKIGIGHCDWLTVPGSVPIQVPIPRSISFAKLDQTGFDQFYAKAEEYLLREIIPGVGKEELERQVLEILNDQRNY